MKVLLIIISILIIAIVLLQSGKAEGASHLITGGADLFKNRKERGGELFITRTTIVLGILFFVLSIIGY